jgi:hypothetical protein
VAGKDRLDATSLPTEPRNLTEGLDGGVSGMRIGVVREWLGQGGHRAARAPGGHLRGRHPAARRLRAVRVLHPGAR